MYGDTVILLNLVIYFIASNERRIFALEGKGKGVLDFFVTMHHWYTGRQQTAE